MIQERYAARYAQSLMNTFGPPKLTLVRGEGAHVWDADGKEYVDLLGGIAVNALGHGHPALVAAVTTQLQTLGHVSNFFATEPQIGLAEKLLALLDAGPGKVFFTNSGAEANEAAFKLTRRTGRTHVVAAEGGFHGRTMGALALTSKAAYREPFEPLPGDVTFVPYGDERALAEAVTDRTAAILLEPIQGEAGVEVPPEGYLAAARRIADEHGALLWLDEVQTGMGRTGQWFAHHAEHIGGGVTADIVTVAKGLAGGFPIGACIGLGAAGELLQPGNHGTTFGGNPVACTAALAVIGTIEAEGLLEHVTVLGQKLRDGLAADPRVTEVRGAGLLIGLDLAEEKSAEVFAAALEAGFIINNPTPSRIRLAPPLVLTEADAAAFLDAWPSDPGRRRALVTRHFLADDDLTRPSRPQVLDLAAEAQGLAVRRPALRRPAVGRDDLRQAHAAHPGVVRGRHRRARRQPDAGRRQAGRHRRPGVRRGRRPGARPAGLDDRLAHLRAVRPRADGRVRRRARRQRADRRVPPLPAPGGPAHRARAQGRAGRADGDLRRRRRQQHGQLLAARRRHRRHARAGGGTARLLAERGDVRAGQRHRRADRWLRDRILRARSRRSPAPTSS